MCKKYGGIGQLYVGRQQKKQRHHAAVFYYGYGESVDSGHTVQVSAVLRIMSRRLLKPFFAFTSSTCAATS